MTTDHVRTRIAALRERLDTIDTLLNCYDTAGDTPALSIFLGFADIHRQIVREADDFADIADIFARSTVALSPVRLTDS